jgi:hypothetical protein
LTESWIVATTDEALQRVGELEAAGVSRIMAGQLLHRDLDAVELLGRVVASVASAQASPGAARSERPRVVEQQPSAAAMIRPPGAGGPRLPEPPVM